IGNVPHGGDRHPQPRIWTGVGSVDAIQGIAGVDCAEDPIAVRKRVTQIPQQFILGLRRGWTALLAMLRWCFALDLIEEAIVPTGDVLYLLGKTARPLELTGGGNESVLFFRHRFGRAEKLLLCELQRPADAVCNAFGNAGLLRLKRKAGEHK